MTTTPMIMAKMITTFIMKTVMATIVINKNYLDNHLGGSFEFVMARCCCWPFGGGPPVLQQQVNFLSRCYN